MTGSLKLLGFPYFDWPHWYLHSHTVEKSSDFCQPYRNLGSTKLDKEEKIEWEVFL